MIAKTGNNLVVIFNKAGNSFVTPMPFEQTAVVSSTLAILNQMGGYWALGLRSRDHFSTKFDS